MSDEFPDFDAGAAFTVALTRGELEQIRNGGNISKHWHPLWMKADALIVFIGRNPPAKDSITAKRAIKNGASICPFPITAALLKEIEGGDTIPTAVFNPWQFPAGNHLLAPAKFTISVTYEENPNFKRIMAEKRMAKPDAEGGRA